MESWEGKEPSWPGHQLDNIGLSWGVAERLLVQGWGLGAKESPESVSRMNAWLAGKLKSLGGDRRETCDRSCHIAQMDARSHIRCLI